MKISGIIVGAAVFLAAAVSMPVDAQTVLTSREAAEVLRFEKLDVKAERITGVIVNKTPHTIRDVQLMIQYHWLWRNERNPGEDAPGRTVMFQLNKQLARIHIHTAISATLEA